LRSLPAGIHVVHYLLAAAFLRPLSSLRPMTARPPGSFEIIGALRYLLIIILCFAEALQNEATRNTVEVIYTVNTRLANESRLIWQFSNFAPCILEEMPDFLHNFNLNSLCLKFNENAIFLFRYHQFALCQFLWIKFILLFFFVFVFVYLNKCCWTFICMISNSQWFILNYFVLWRNKFYCNIIFINFIIIQYKSIVITRVFFEK